MSISPYFDEQILHYLKEGVSMNASTPTCYVFCLMSRRQLHTIRFENLAGPNGGRLEDDDLRLLNYSCGPYGMCAGVAKSWY
jgi:hypothetical protein